MLGKIDERLILQGEFVAPACEESRAFKRA